MAPDASVPRWRQNATHLLPAAVSTVAIGAVGWVTANRMSSYGHTDYQVHILYARGWSEGMLPMLPQFLFEVLVAAAHWAAPGVSLTFIGYALVVASFALTGTAAHIFWRSQTSWKRSAGAHPIAILAVLAICLQGVVFLPTLSQHSLYLGYVAANVYHNPTIVLLKPFALLLLACAAFTFRNSPFRGFLAIVVVLSVLSTIAKPSYAICLIPALTLIAGWRWVKRLPLNLPVYAAVVGPMLILLPVQWLLYRRSGLGGAAGVEPLAVVRLQHQIYGKAALGSNIWLAAKLLLSVPLPLAVLATHFPSARRDAVLGLAWLSFIVGVLYSYLLAEAPPQTGAGNFLWSGQITAFLLFAASLAFWWRQPRRPRGRFALILLTAVVQLGTGLFWWSTQTAPPTPELPSPFTAWW